MSPMSAQVLCACSDLKCHSDALDGLVGQYRRNRQEAASLNQRIEYRQGASLVSVRGGKLIQWIAPWASRGIQRALAHQAGIVEVDMQPPVRHGDIVEARWPAAYACVARLLNHAQAGLPILPDKQQECAC